MKSDRIRDPGPALLTYVDPERLFKPTTGSIIMDLLTNQVPVPCHKDRKENTPTEGTVPVKEKRAVPRECARREGAVSLPLGQILSYDSLAVHTLL